MLAFLLGLFLTIPQTPNVTSLPHFCTVVDPDFVEYRYEVKMPYCKRNVNTSMRNRVYEDYNVPVAERVNYTVDHIIPLSLGGSNHRLNLWAQHKSISTASLETQLYYKVKRGEVHPQSAINDILKVKYQK